MAELDSAALSKRTAWATRSGTETYIQEMGRYAVERDAQIVREMLGTARTSDAALLDLPCGTGRFLDLEKELGFEVTGADYSPTMMGVAQRHPNVKFVQADAFNPPFAPDSFDAILIIRLMFHYRNPEDILAALLPSLRPGGRIIFDTLNTFSLRWWASKVIGLVRRDPARRLYFESFSTMQAKLRKLGLKVVGRRSAYYYPTRLYRMLPGPLVTLTHLWEKLVPQRFRVLTYWHVERE